jgi:hypothetical protein
LWATEIRYWFLLKAERVAKPILSVLAGGSVVLG